MNEAIPPLTREAEAPIEVVRAKSKNAILIDEYLVQHPEALQLWKSKELSANQIAIELGISRPTVNNYLKTLP